MTHQNQSNQFNAAVQLLADYGFEGMANAMQILFNESMKIERSEYLNAAPYQRTEERRSYANGFKEKTVNTRLGKLELRVPQTRDSEFYHPHWSGVKGAKEPLSWPSRKCTSREFRRGKLRRLPPSYVDWK